MSTPDPLYALHTSIIAALKADATLSPLVKGIYSNLPKDAKFPCIAVANTVAKDSSSRTTKGFYVGIGINIFSRERDSTEASNLMAEVRRILENAALAPSGCKVTSIREVDNKIHRLADGVTWSASINFLVILQEGSNTFVGDGNQLVIKIGNGATPTEIFTVIGGLRNVGIGLANQVVNASNVTSGRWRKLISGAGIAALTVKGNGFFTDSSSEEALRSAAFSGSSNNYEMVFSNNDKISGAFIISKYERIGDANAEEGFFVSLESSGEVSYSG